MHNPNITIEPAEGLDGWTMISGNCPKCKIPWMLTVPSHCYESWMKGAFVQVAFPLLTVDERELLITGLCVPCRDKMFKE